MRIAPYRSALLIPASGHPARRSVPLHAVMRNDRINLSVRSEANFDPLAYERSHRPWTLQDAEISITRRLNEARLVRHIAATQDHGGSDRRVKHLQDLQKEIVAQEFAFYKASQQRFERFGRITRALCEAFNCSKFEELATMSEEHLRYLFQGATKHSPTPRIQSIVKELDTSDIVPFLTYALKQIRTKADAETADHLQAGMCKQFDLVAHHLGESDERSMHAINKLTNDVLDNVEALHLEQKFAPATHAALARLTGLTIRRGQHMAIFDPTARRVLDAIVKLPLQHRSKPIITLAEFFDQAHASETQLPVLKVVTKRLIDSAFDALHESSSRTDVAPENISGFTLSLKKLLPKGYTYAFYTKTEMRKIEKTVAKLSEPIQAQVTFDSLGHLNEEEILRLLPLIFKSDVISPEVHSYYDPRFSFLQLGFLAYRLPESVRSQAMEQLFAYIAQNAEDIRARSQFGRGFSVETAIAMRAMPADEANEHLASIERIMENTLSPELKQSYIEQIHDQVRELELSPIWNTALQE